MINTPIKRKYNVHLDNMTMNMSIGILPHEKKIRQPVILSLKLTLKKTTEPILNLKQSICYNTLAEEIRLCAHKKHYDLIEEFAENILHLCRQKPHVKKIHLTVKKPQALKNATAAVSLSYTHPKNISPNKNTGRAI